MDGKQRQRTLTEEGGGIQDGIQGFWKLGGSRRELDLMNAGRRGNQERKGKLRSRARQTPKWRRPVGTWTCPSSGM